MRLADCEVTGCGRPSYAKRMCSMHHRRWLRTGTAGEAERRRSRNGTGAVTPNGYRMVTVVGHPVAYQNGLVAEHRVVLFDAIGYGPHLCHWCGRVLHWRSSGPAMLVSDHVDQDRLHNAPSNLVPSCCRCNVTRAG